MIVLVGNKGSFGEECAEYLLQAGYLTSRLLSEQLDISDIDLHLTRVVDSNQGKPLDAVVYIGGETRDSNKMIYNNLDLPLALAASCARNKCQFVMLGSLSQFGKLPYRKGYCITPLSPEHAPYDDYSKTKQQCALALKSMPWLFGHTICPASILNHQRRGGSIYQIRGFMKSTLVGRYFNFFAKISYCERVDIYEAICIAIDRNYMSGVSIVAKLIEVRDITKSFVLPTKWLMFLFGYFLHLVLEIAGRNDLAQKCTLLFTDVEFVNDYSEVSNQ